MNDNLELIKQQIWEATNYGRDFFLDEFASQIANNRGRIKGFRVRPNDDNGSCHLYQRNSTSPYTFTDFGVSSEGLNAIDYLMQRDHCTVWEAIKKLCASYGVSLPEGKKIAPKTEFSSTPTEEVGTWSVQFADDLKNTKVIRRLFPFYTKELLEQYNFKEVISYTTIGISDKGKYKKTVQATPEFPIFGYDKGNYVKLYQPFADRKDIHNPKHHFVGNKTGKRIIYGWDRLQNLVDIEEINALNEELKNAKTKETRNQLTSQINTLKLDSVIIATGGTDGINIASLGYNVIWFNSETEVINAEEYNTLSMIAKRIYYVPDLDTTGVRQATYIADTFIDIRLVWLPQELKKNRKKDFADWIRSLHTAGENTVKNLFKQMLQQALNFRFWSLSEKGTVQFSPTKVIHFLNLQGYYTYTSSYTELKEDECDFVSLQNGCISKVISTNIKNFVLQWLDNKVFVETVRNRVFSSVAFQPSHLKMLPPYTNGTPHCGRNFQWYFFANKAVKIEANTIAEYNYTNALPVRYWQEQIINHPLNIQPPAFQTYTDEQGRLRLRNINTTSGYFKVLINSSRIYWEQDACPNTEEDLHPFQITSPNLTDEENYLQELHLLNKIYCVGYLLHQHKRSSEAYIVMGTDYKGGATARGSYGGTGKSFLVNGVRTMIKSKYIDGKTIGNDKFPFDKVDERTRLVFLDDMNFNQDFREFYNKVTGDFEANHKGGKILYIPFEKSPKMAATTNYVPDFEESSLVRRLLFYQNSDYYHAKTPKNNYQFTRKISDSFGGRDIMDSDCSEEEWNADYNFMLNCLQFFLASPNKVEAPLQALENRRAFINIGDNFMAFFNDYFSNTENLNNYISRPEFNRTALEEVGGKYPANQIYNKLSEYCTMKGWVLTKAPRKINGQSTVCFYVEATPQATPTGASTTPHAPTYQAPPAPTTYQAPTFDNLDDGIDF